MSTEKWNSRWGSGIEQILFQDGKVGATSGWTVRAAANTWMSTVAQSQTAATLVIPFTGLVVGDVLTGFHLMGQIDSAGNTATLDAQLYEFVPAAAGSAAAALTGTNMTQVSVTADTLLSDLNAKKTFDEAYRVTVDDGKSYFALLTATTAATTDIELLGLYLHVLKAR